MDAERWGRIDELLQAALRVPVEQQDEFLRRQCGNDNDSSKKCGRCSLRIARQETFWSRQLSALPTCPRRRQTPPQLQRLFGPWQV